MPPNDPRARDLPAVAPRAASSRRLPPRPLRRPELRAARSSPPRTTGTSPSPGSRRLSASKQIIKGIGRSESLFADFGSGTYDGGPIGIPFTTVGGGQARVPVEFGYADESDPGPYPIPPDAPVEGGPGADGDRHVLVIDRADCVLYELYDAHPLNGGARWRAGSGAVFDLNSNALRPDGWTSPTPPGWPILPRPGALRRGRARRDRPRAAVHRRDARATSTSTRRRTTPARPGRTCRRWGPV